MRWVRRLLLLCLLLPLVLVAAGYIWLQTAAGHRQLASLIADVTRESDNQVTIGGIEGSIPGDFTLHDVSIADHQGVWLKSDRLHLAWSPLALLGRKAVIDILDIGQVTLLRQPVSSTPAQPSSSTPGFPRLPLDIKLRQASIGQLHLPATLAGTAMDLAIQLEAQASRQGDVAGKLAVHRLDDPAGGDDIVAEIAYAGASDHLKLDLAIAEPRGGLVTRSLGLAGPHSLTISAKGDAPLSDWTGTVIARLDDASLLDLTARISGSKETRQFDLALKADPSPLLPARLQPLLQGGITIASTGTAQMAAAPKIDLKSFDLKSTAADITAHGLIDPAGDSKLDLTINNRSSDVFATLLPQLTWKNATITGEVSGALSLPKVDLTAGIDGLSFAGNLLDRMTLTLTATPGSTTTAPIAVLAKLAANGVHPAEAKLQDLPIGDIVLDLDATVDRSGTIAAKTIALTSGLASLTGQADITGWGQTINAKASATAGDLAAFKALAGMPLAGSLKLDLTANRSANGADIALQGGLQDFASGQAPVDHLLGPAPQLVLHAIQTPDQIVQLSEAKLTGTAVTLSTTGHAGASELALHLDASLPNLAAIDPQVAGGVTLAADLAGSPEKPQLSARLVSDRLKAASLQITNLALNAEVPDLKQLTTATLRGKANVNGLPATLAGDVSLSPGSGPRVISIDRLDAQLGGSALAGQLKIVNGLLAGKIKLTVPELAELKPLTQADVKGKLTVDTSLASDSGRQAVAATIIGRDIASGTSAKISQLSLDAKIGDALGTPNITARLDLAGVSAGKELLATANAKANGPLSNLGFTIAGSGPQLNLDLAGAVAKGATSETLTLQKTKLQAYGQQIALARPATITHQGANLQIDHLELQNGNGLIALDGKLSPAGNQLELRLQRLSLAVLGAVMPTPRLAGEVNGTITLAGSSQNPQATIALTADQITSKDLAIPPTAIKVNVGWQGGRLDARSEIKLASQDQPLLVTAALPLPADPASGLPRVDMSAEMTAAVTGKVDLALANGLLLDSVSRLTGRADIDLKINGPLRQPNIAGQVAIVDGSYGNLRTGTRLRAIDATIIANGSRIELQQFSAKTPGNGNLGGTGYVTLGEKREVNIHLTAQNAQLLDSALVAAVADADLSLATTEGQNLQLTGTVKVDRADINIPDRLAGSVQEIAVTEQNAGAKSSAPATDAGEAEPQNAKAAAPIRIALDLTIDAPQQVAIRGRGLDAELGGKLHVSGEAAKPIIKGQLKLRHGAFNLVGRNLNFDHGIITFDGGASIDPLLDFVAKAKADAYDIIVTVSGTATKPTLALTSTPALPQDEALARLLFDRPAGALSPLQALQLAQATATLAGVNSGPGILDKIRQKTGLDRLNVDAGDDAGSKTAATGPSLNAGRYVAPGVYLGVKQGTKAGSSAATVELDVTSHVKVETDIGAADSSKAGVSMQWDY